MQEINYSAYSFILFSKKEEGYNYVHHTSQDLIIMK